MNPNIFALIFLGVILGAFILFYLIPVIIISSVIYTVLLVRTDKEKWSRTVSWENEEQQAMFDTGKAWGDLYEENRKEVTITSCGFKLVGEYFDFGSDKVALIIPGRMESGTYSYYFAEPYRALGYNILAIDNRSHGLSEGKYNCVGLKEYKDILAWMKYAHDELNNKSVIIHGICIGSATALNALVQKDAPDYVEALIADGMYINFKENFKNHLIERGKSVFPYTQIVMFIITLVAKKSPNKICPINQIENMKKPMLFIYSKEDIYSVPKYGTLLYEKCGSEKKKIEFFEHGEHSHVRINDVKKYDKTITDFVKSL